MCPTSARSSSGRVNRYYVSLAVIRKDRGEAGSAPRIPAETAEALVVRELAGRVDPNKVGEKIEALVRMTVSVRGVELTLDQAKLRIDALDPSRHDDPLIVRIPVVLKTFGGSRQIMDGGGAPIVAPEPDLALQKAIARARTWDAQLSSGERSGADEIAAAEGLQSRYVDKVIRLASLSPEITEAIAQGRRFRDYSLTELLERELPLSWERQGSDLVIV